MKRIITVALLSLVFATSALAANAPGVCPTWSHKQLKQLSSGVAVKLRAKRHSVKMSSCVLMLSVWAKGGNVQCFWMVDGHPVTRTIKVTANKCPLKGTPGAPDTLTGLISEISRSFSSLP